MQSEPKKILIADEDASVRMMLSQAFLRLGWQVRATGSAATLLKWVSEGDGDLVISDLFLADCSALEMLPRLRKQRPKLPVVLLSAQYNVLTAINAAEAGVFDHLAKPVNPNDVVAAAKRALRPIDKDAVKAQARAARADRLPLIGSSPTMHDVYRTLARLVSNDLTVLISGESGTGKELVARVLHEMGPRRERAFAAISLASTSADRLEAKLFGDERNSLGKLIEADGGTLFLDGVDGLSLEAQTRLLRVIDGAEPVINPKTQRRVNVRIIASTTRDLSALMREGAFRDDLFFRLNVAPVRLPPLRERIDDIPELARAFLVRAGREGLPVKTIDEGAIDRLKAHKWPGNVRELENLIRRGCALYAEEVITPRLVERELSDIAAAEAPRGNRRACPSSSNAGSAPTSTIPETARRRCTTICWTSLSGLCSA